MFRRFSQRSQGCTPVPPLTHPSLKHHASPCAENPPSRLREEILVCSGICGLDGRASIDMPFNLTITRGRQHTPLLVVRRTHIMPSQTNHNPRCDIAARTSPCTPTTITHAQVNICSSMLQFDPSRRLVGGSGGDVAQMLSSLAGHLFLTSLPDISSLHNRPLLKSSPPFRTQHAVTAWSATCTSKLARYCGFSFAFLACVAA